MTLKNYYEHLPDAVYPKTNFINEIVCRTGVSATTVRNWIHYGMKPSNKAYIKIISEITNIPCEDLWKD